MYDKKEIIEKYTKLKSVWKVAEEMGCCGQYVHEVLVKNNIEMSRKKFSKDDEAFLLENYSRYRNEKKLQELANELGRTKQFICRKAAGLGLTKNNKRKYYKLDLRGRRFGRLTGVKPVGKNNSNSFDWEFLCDCGNSVIICGTSVFLGHTKSCGCLQREKTGDASRTHGLSGSRIYKTYHLMINRCENGKNKDYKWYGGKGVSVCSEWKKSFESFYEWAMKNGYSDNLTIDRIDPNGDYTPENCQWLTIQENVKKAWRERA